jgi:hypothetical protein
VPAYDLFLPTSMPNGHQIGHGVQESLENEICIRLLGSLILHGIRERVSYDPKTEDSVRERVVYATLITMAMPDQIVAKLDEIYGADANIDIIPPR